MEHVCFHYYSKISQGSLFILQNLAYMDICKDIYIGKMTSLRDIWENPIFSVDFDSSLSPSVEFCKNFVIYILKGALQRGGGGFLRKIRIFLLERFLVARVPKKALKKWSFWEKTCTYRNLWEKSFEKCRRECQCA